MKRSKMTIGQLEAQMLEFRELLSKLTVEDKRALIEAAKIMREGERQAGQRRDVPRPPVRCDHRRRLDKPPSDCGVLTARVNKLATFQLGCGDVAGFSETADYLH
jgi:hypothetical protein